MGVRGIREIQIFFFFFDSLSLLPSEEIPLSLA